MVFVQLTNSNGNVSIAPPPVPTENDQLVDKGYVDTRTTFINQINLSDYVESIQEGAINIDLSSNTFNYITNDITPYSGLLSGVDGSVNALTFDNEGNLFVGGQFMNATNVSVNNLAKWNGENYNDVGGGVIGSYRGQGPLVKALTFDNSNNLFLGGNFVEAGTIQVWTIAKYNGNVYSKLGQGIQGDIKSLACDTSGNLYIGGTIEYAVQTNTNILSNGCILGWNDASGLYFGLTGGGVNGVVNALKMDNSGNLFAGGAFTNAGGVSVSNIAKWNRSDWYSLGGGVNGTVYALTTDASNNLYVGGNFTDANGELVSNIAKWNGSAWISLGGGVNGPVYALATDTSNNLYVGGDFNVVGETSATNIAKWDGNNWYSISDGINGPVYALTFDGTNNIYVGGKFNMVTANCNNIVKININSIGIETVDVSVNTKNLYNLSYNETINVNVTNINIPYTNGLCI